MYDEDEIPYQIAFVVQLLWGKECIVSLLKCECAGVTITVKFALNFRPLQYLYYLIDKYYSPEQSRGSGVLLDHEERVEHHLLILIWGV